MSRRLTSISAQELAIALDLSTAFVRTREGKILHWSTGSEKVYGWRRAEAVGKLSHDLLQTRFSDTLRNIDATLAKHGEWSGNLVHRTKDGRVLNVFSHWILAPAKGRWASSVVEINVVASGLQPLLASLVASTSDAVIGVSLDSIITSWNASAEKLFEYHEAEVVGQPISILFPPSLLDEESSLIARVREGARIDHYETTRIAKSGKALTVSLSLSPIYDFAGDLVGISKIARDVTERRMQEDALRRANASLEEFAYAAAHDLQEPLRNISLSVQQLERFYTEMSLQEREEVMAGAVRNANRMQALIKDLLSFSRVIPSSQEAPQLCDTNAIVRQALENLSQSIEESRASVVINYPLPAARMHPSHLLQLMQNLLGNAVKYRDPERAPIIQVGGRSERSHVVFSVADNGVGVETQFHQRIFGVFKRLDTTKPGTGIGLAVCKRIVEHYSGGIWIESEPGAGSTFYFSVPS